MREIKFRVWDGEDMLPVGDSTEFKNAKVHKIRVTHKYNNLLESDCKDFHVMQFTGLHDKNGNEIYEGDIIGDWVEVDGKMEQSKHTVFFHEQEGQWMLDNSLHQDRTHLFSLAQELRDFEYEIIGNIHENPELLS